MTGPQAPLLIEAKTRILQLRIALGLKPSDAFKAWREEHALAVPVTVEEHEAFLTVMEEYEASLTAVAEHEAFLAEEEERKAAKPDPFDFDAADFKTLSSTLLRALFDSREVEATEAHDPAAAFKGARR